MRLTNARLSCRRPKSIDIDSNSSPPASLNVWCIVPHRVMLSKAEKEELFRWVVDDDSTDDLVEQLLQRKNARIKQLEEEAAALEKRRSEGGRAPKRVYDYRGGQDSIVKEYFGYGEVRDDEGKILSPAIEPDCDQDEFHRRWSMSRRMFEKIHSEITDPQHGSNFFMRGADAAGKFGFSSHQRLFAALRQLCNGTATDQIQGIVNIPNQSSRNSLREFCEWCAKFYGHIIMGEWTDEELREALAVNTKRGFPGMIGSIDCKHWVWKNSPPAWRTMFLTNKDYRRSVVMEAIAGHDLYLSHVFVGMPGTRDDLNVLGSIKNKYMKSGAHKMTFELNGEERKGVYFLADEAYPDGPYFLKTIPHPTTAMTEHYRAKHASVRKDVHRAFRKMETDYKILQREVMQWSLKLVSEMWITIAILHNLSIRDLQQAQEPHEHKNLLQLVTVEEGLAIGLEGEGIPFTFQEPLDGIVQSENAERCSAMRDEVVSHLWAQRDA